MDKSCVGMLDDKIRDNTATKGVSHFFHYFSPFQEKLCMQKHDLCEVTSHRTKNVSHFQRK